MSREQRAAAARVWSGETVNDNAAQAQPTTDAGAATGETMLAAPTMAALAAPATVAAVMLVV